MKAILAHLSGLVVVATWSHAQEAKYNWTNTNPLANAKLVERSPAEWEEISKRAIEELKLHGKKPEATPAPAAAPVKPFQAPRLQLVRVPQPAPLPQFKFDGVRLIKRELPQPINLPPGQQPVVRPHPTKPGVVLVPQWMIDYEPDFVREREAAEAQRKAQQDQLEKQKREQEAMLAEQEAQRAAFAAEMEHIQQEAEQRRQHTTRAAARSHYAAPVYSDDWEIEELREQAEQNEWEIQQLQDEIQRTQDDAWRMRDDLEWQLMQERQHRWMDCPSERGRHGTLRSWRGR